MKHKIITSTLTSGHEHSLQNCDTRNCSGIGNLVAIIDVGTTVSALTVLLSFYCYVRRQNIYHLFIPSNGQSSYRKPVAYTGTCFVLLECWLDNRHCYSYSDSVIHHRVHFLHVQNFFRGNQISEYRDSLFWPTPSSACTWCGGA